MSEMIERIRVAADMFLTHEVERDTLACDLTPDEQRHLARAVLAAIRSPTFAMVKALDDEDDDKYVARGRAIFGWQTMIDIALAESHVLQAPPAVYRSDR